MIAISAGTCSGDLQHFVFYVFDVDWAMGLVVFFLKFEPNERIILHRHLTLTQNTFVVQGSIVFTEPNGALKEISSHRQLYLESTG